MKKIRHKLLLVCFSTLIGLIIAEVLTRILVPQIGWRPFKDETLGWSSEEYQQFEPSNDKRSQDKTRILVLGDSFLAGHGVSSKSKLFPNVMNKLLGDKASVKIFAAAGWGTDQQLLAFLEKGKRWKPDLVILAFCANNDLSDILRNNHGLLGYKSYFKLDNKGQLQFYDFEGNDADIEFSKHSRDKVRYRSYFLDLFRYVILASKKTAENTGEQVTEHNFEKVDPRYLMFDFREEKPEEIYRLDQRLSWSPQSGNTHVSAYIHEDFEINSYQWKLFEAILKKLRDESENIDARFMVMLLPAAFKPQDARFIAGKGGELEFKFQTPDGPFTFRAAEPGDRLARISEKLGIEYFDPSRKFVKIITERDLVKACWPNPKDRHFSSVAHRILGQLLYKHLEEHPKLLKR